MVFEMLSKTPFASVCIQSAGLHFTRLHTHSNFNQTKAANPLCRVANSLNRSKQSQSQRTASLLRIAPLGLRSCMMPRQLFSLVATDVLVVACEHGG